MQQLTQEISRQRQADMRGAAYLYTLDAGWIRNPFYVSVPELEQWAGSRFSESLPDLPLYRLFAEMPERLGWLLEPERFGEVFPDLWEKVSTTTGT